MKPPERFPPDDPREWLNRARSNLARAKVSVSGAYLEDLCFDAQQASEKAIVNGTERCPVFGKIRCPIFCTLKDSNPGCYPEAALPSSSFTATLSIPALRLVLSR